MKLCKKCGKEKSLSEFYFHSVRKQYAARCRECMAADNRAYYERNQAKIKGQSKAWREENRDYYTSYLKAYGPKRHRELKLAALKVYGMQCACCGEAGTEFLTIDHIDNDGHIHRREINYRNIYEWLKNSGYPTDRRLQTLCFNCNFAKRYNGGVCPHQEHPEASETIPSGSTPKRAEARVPSED